MNGHTTTQLQVPSDARYVSELLRADGATGNQLLAALPQEDLERIRPHLEWVRLPQRALLFEPEQPIPFVYSPVSTVVCLVSSLEDGATVEVGTAGCEGMAGLSVFLAEDTSSVQAFAQVPGDAFRVESKAFTGLTRASGAFHQVLLRYTHVFLTQVVQSSICNAAHFIKARCARWLLMTHDRVGGDEFPLTHEFLAFMLGVRRPGVTIAMHSLQEAGLVRYKYGKVSIVDRVGLEAVSCECYHVVRTHYDRLLPRAA